MPKEGEKSSDRPFRGTILKIVSVSDGLGVIEVDEAGNRRSRRFTFGKNLWKVDDNSVEFKIDCSRQNNPSHSELRRNVIEGTIRLHGNGKLEVKSDCWEKGLKLYVLPFFNDSQASMVFHQLPDDLIPIIGDTHADPETSGVEQIAVSTDSSSVIR